jgi:thiol-disulfide isomerase/thioredoxin
MRFRSAERFSAILLMLGLTAAQSKEPPKYDLNLKDTAGRRVHLKDLRGKNVVLNFWATWCAPCKAEMPLLAAAEKEYGTRGVVFIAASLDDAKNSDSIIAYLNARQVSFPAWIGATSDDLERLEMGPAVPATAFLDQEGHIVYRIEGQMQERELKERLEWLTGYGRGDPPDAVVMHLGK